MRLNRPSIRSLAKEEGQAGQAPSSSEEGVGGGVTSASIRKRARDLRNNPTAPEEHLWQALRGSQLQGLKFRRQAAKGNRIFDFFCPAHRLAVEIDGMTHDRAADHERDCRFEISHGIRTLRFTNEEVMRNLEGVLQAILIAVATTNHPPTPSLAKEGEHSAVPSSPTETGERGSKAHSSPEEGVGGGVLSLPSLASEVE